MDEGVLDPHEIELIIVDDGSTDATAERAAEVLPGLFDRLQVLRIDRNAGKGAAVRLGAGAATAPVVVFMDADMSVDPSEISGLVDGIGRADIAIGSRSLADSVVETDGVQRKVMGWTFNTIVTTVTGMPFADTQCGFKAFRTPIARLLFHLMTVERFAFDVEVLYLAQRLRMDITEVPVRWREMRPSKVRVPTDPISMTRDVVRARTRRERPTVPGLAVEPAPEERRRSPSRIVAELHQAFGSNFPILLPAEDEVVLLVPLGDSGEIEEIAARIRRLPTRLTVREHAVSFQELVSLAPFSLHDGILVASYPGAAALTLREPVDGWESVRSIPGDQVPSRLLT